MALHEPMTHTELNLIQFFRKMISSLRMALVCQFKKRIDPPYYRKKLGTIEVSHFAYRVITVDFRMRKTRTD